MSNTRHFLFVLSILAATATAIIAQPRIIVADKIPKGRTANEKVYEYVLPANEQVVHPLTSYSQAASQTRVRFVRGKSSATMNGTLARSQARCFDFGARQGQKIDARVSSKNGAVQFSAMLPGARLENAGGTRYSEIAFTGDNQVCIINDGNTSTRYSFWISIR